MKVSELTVEELRELIKTQTYIAMDEALLDFFGDHDEGLEFSEEFASKLMESMEETKKGAKGIPVKEVRKDLGL